MYLQKVISRKNCVKKLVRDMDPRVRIRIHQIHMFLGLPDPDPLVRSMDPDPSIIMQK